MSVHFRVECKHGVVIRTCRCTSKDKTVKIVACPPTCTHYNDYVPKHLKQE